MKKSGFGAPKPLPGQPGYKYVNIVTFLILIYNKQIFIVFFRAAESEILDKEAREMEARLKMLNERMKQQSEVDISQASGGTKWKSSRQEKGGIRNFGKEVNEKYRKKIEAEGGVDMLARTSASSTSRQSSFKRSTADEGDFCSKGQTD